MGGGSDIIFGISRQEGCVVFGLAMNSESIQKVAWMVR